MRGQAYSTRDIVEKYRNRPRAGQHMVVWTKNHLMHYASKPGGVTVNTRYTCNRTLVKELLRTGDYEQHFAGGDDVIIVRR